MTTQIRSSQIIDAIGCPLLELVKGNGYWYFVYDDSKKIFETESVMVVNLNQMTLDKWVQIGASFVKSCEGRAEDVYVFEHAFQRIFGS